MTDREERSSSASWAFTSSRRRLTSPEESYRLECEGLISDCDNRSFAPLPPTSELHPPASECETPAFDYHPPAPNYETPVLDRHSPASDRGILTFARHGIASAHVTSRLDCHSSAFDCLPLAFNFHNCTFENNSPAFNFNNPAVEFLPPKNVLVGETCRDDGYKDDIFCLIFRRHCRCFLTGHSKE